MLRRDRIFKHLFFCCNTHVSLPYSSVRTKPALCKVLMFCRLNMRCSAGTVHFFTGSIYTFPKTFLVFDFYLTHFLSILIQTLVLIVFHSQISYSVFSFRVLDNQNIYLAFYKHTSLNQQQLDSDDVIRTALSAVIYLHIMQFHPLVLPSPSFLHSLKTAI